MLVGGTVWRYRYDQFGWTTRSSQLYESRLLRIGSPLFHFGILFVLIGHIIGLLIPESWTEAVGVSEHLYHVNAVLVGGIAGLCTLLGILILIYRRRTTGPVFMATTRNDKAMYVALVAAIVLGLVTTIAGAGVVGESYNYRETVSVWFRSLFVLQPDVAAMEEAPWTFHVHVLVAMLLIAMWPFTRLIHAFTAPVHYLFRPYVVYRSKAIEQSPAGVATRRGWDPVGTADRDK
jgi:nitrate reductase gamma subunit